MVKCSGYFREESRYRAPGSKICSSQYQEHNAAKGRVILKDWDRLKQLDWCIATVAKDSFVVHYNFMKPRVCSEKKSYYFINNFLFSSAVYGFDSTSRACERQNVSNSFPFNILTKQLINVFCLAIKWILKNSSNHISLICRFSSLNLPSAGNSAGNCDSVVLNTYLKCFIHHHF